MWMGDGKSPSSRSERKTTIFSSPSAIPAWDCPRDRRTRFSMRSLRQNLRGPAWDCPSAEPSLNHMAAACGLLTTLLAARAFALACPPKSRHRKTPARHQSVLLGFPRYREGDDVSVKRGHIVQKKII